MSLHIPCWLGSKLLGFVINLSREKKTYKNLQQLGGKSSGQKNIVYIQNFEVAKNKQVILSNNSFWQKKMHNFGHYTISGCSQPPCKWCDLPYNLLLLGTYLIIPSSTRSGKQLLYQLETLRMRRIFTLRRISKYRLSTILYHIVLNIIYKMQVPLTSQIAKGSLLTGQEQGCNRLTQLVGLVLSCPK